MDNIRTYHFPLAASLFRILFLFLLSLVMVACGGGGGSSSTVDTQSPQITLTTPSNNLITNQSAQIIDGQTNEDVTLTINGQTVSLGAAFNFTSAITLQEGDNNYVLQATDQAQNSTTLNLTITLDTIPPVSLDLSMLTIGN